MGKIRAVSQKQFCSHTLDIIQEDTASTFTKVGIGSSNSTCQGTQSHNKLIKSTHLFSSRVAGRPQQHQVSPMNHHRQYPMTHCYILQLFLPMRLIPQQGGSFQLCILQVEPAELRAKSICVHLQAHLTPAPA